MRRAYSAIFFIQCIFLNICSGELTNEKKQEFLNGFIESLNNQPDKPYIYEEGVLVDAQKINDDNNYKISVRLKVSDVHDIDAVKILKCSVSVVDGANGVTIQNEHHCEDDPEASVADAQESVDAGSTEAPVEGITGPVQLANEVQSDAEVTSGEQFVAIPRPSAPCIGCATHVDPTAAGVPEMAHLGIRHLDLHNPSTKHALKTVVDVERQVQVVNGVRYILTLLVDFNNCTAPSAEPCPVSAACKISILEKPWKKLPDGTKYRAIVANNCTAEWLFGDEGEVLPSERNSENNELYPDSSGNFDDDLRVVHNFDTQAQPNQEKTLTDEMVKSVEDQIIPLSEFKTPESPDTATAAEHSVPTLENTEHVQEDETVQHYNEDSAPVQQSHANQANSLNEDQRRAIDDMMNFFNFAGFHKSSDEHQRTKRSYNDDLKVLALAKKFQKMKRSIDNANYVHKLARTMVEYLNEHDMLVKNRILKDVLAAEQENDNDKHFFYLQALITIPCRKEHCDEKENTHKICNGVIDGSSKTSPQVLNTFCYDDERENLSSKAKTVPFDDPILAKLAKRALMKIESESTKVNAMRILKILDATTQKSSGRLTKISMLLSYTNCKKSLDFNKRLNCSTVEDLGSEICDVTIHQRINEKKEMKIHYICNERGIHESFVDTEHSNKRMKNLNDPEIQSMVQEALQYLEKKSNINKKQKLVSIKSVSTKVVAGLVTDVAFTVGYSDCHNDEEVDVNTCQLLLNEAIRECKAQVWDRPWLENGRQVNVKCENEPSEIIPVEVEGKKIPKKHVKLGLRTKQNPDDIKYKYLAEESLQKYLDSVGVSLNQKLVQVTRVTTQVVSGLITEIYFDVYPTNGDTFDCHSKIWDQPLLKKKDVTVDCNMFGQKRRSKRGVPGGESEVDTSQPKYTVLAEESLNQYLQTSGNALPDRQVEVTRVTVQVVSGTLTRIDFNVRPKNGDFFTCHSEVWEQAWIKKKEITVNCNMNNKETRVKRQTLGGQKDQDANDPKYKKLAEESFETYLKSVVGGPIEVKKLVVTKVTTQVVSGIITRIDFNVDSFNGDSIKCNSEVYEQEWLNKREINVDCRLNNQQNRKKREVLSDGLKDGNSNDPNEQFRVKRLTVGGQTDQDPSKPEYKALADESLQKYLQTSGGTLNKRKIEVTKVTTQVVSGTLTRIDFTVRPLNGDSFTCHSKVWEQSWLNKKEITVNCDVNDKQTRVKRQIPGGQNERDPSKPEYKALAEESLQKYLQTSGSTLKQNQIQVNKVTVQVVAGSITTIDFTVRPSNGDSFDCHSEVFEQLWLKKKEITVNCDVNDKQSRVKRQLVGGQIEQDPSKPEYKALAEESLRKYIQTSGSTLNLNVIRVNKVTVQVVAGYTTRIDFTVRSSNGDSFACQSEVLEQPWLKKKEITVNCDVNDKQSRVKRQLVGGQIEQDPSKPEYKALAEESLQKYLQTSGGTLNKRKIEVTKVTTQVVSGTSTRIDFTVRPLNGDSFTCHSKVWEQLWLNKKEITVNCDVNDKHTRVKRQIPGGQNERDPSKPEYKALAEESLQKYLQTSGSTLKQNQIQVNKVTVQVVAGTITRIDFTVRPSNGDSFACHSKVFEQPWLKKKEITVNCDVNDKQTRVKRQIPGGRNEQDPSKPEYKALAEESLQKYLQTSGSTLKGKQIEVNKVTVQVVAGTITRIDFTVRPSNGDSFVCHSEVLEQGWLNRKEISVNCLPNEQLHRIKREMRGGGLIEPDLTDQKYIVLAEESLQKYLQTTGNTMADRKIELLKVTVQVVSGVLTGLDFNVIPANGDPFSCRSEVLEQPWINKREITVDCLMEERRKREIAGNSKKRGSPQEEDSSKPEYKDLAQQSLQKYLKLQNNKSRHDVLEVKRVTSQVVAGRLYEIDFTAAPTTCSNNDKNFSECRPKNETLLFCHSKIWSRVWLKSIKIEVTCNSDTDESETDDMSDEDETKRSTAINAYEELQVKDVTESINNEITENKPVSSHERKLNSKGNRSSKKMTKITNKQSQNKNVSKLINELDKSEPVESQKDTFIYKEHKDLAREAVLKFERLSNSKYMHRISKINRVSEQINEGVLTTIEFNMSPTECLIGGASNVDACKFKEPKVEFLCLSTIWERSWIYLKEIKVSCKNLKAQYVNPTEWDDEIPGARQIQREKRQLRGEDDDYIDEDLTFYYADRAVKEINDRSQSHNLQKLITVHAIDDTLQMGARMIRMYIETAVTFCLRPQATVQLSECEEIDGLNRKLCHVRLWPHPDDELIVQHVAVVCDDDSDFSSVTGLSIPLLITASIKEIEKAQTVKFKLVHQGEPNIVPTLSSQHPIKMSFVVASTNCSKDIDVYKHRDTCFVDTAKPPTACESMTYLVPNSMEVKDVTVKCYGNSVYRKKRSANIDTDKASVDITIGKLVDESLEKLEASSAHRYKQRVVQINTYSTKIKKGRVTTIDFDVGFTSCLKYEYVANISSCEFIEHLPRRHCVSHVYERLWVENGRNIEVICEDDETPLEPNVGLESSEMAMELANEAVKHIEAKYPHPRRLKVVRIFSLEKQALAGIHYRMKIEVGLTDCMALSVKSDCKLKQDTNSNKFCRVNVWIRPWTEHAPNFRVWCDYQESLTTEHHHMLQAEQLFYDFLTTYSPDYVDNYTEMAKRFTIFRANVRKVHELNVHERGTARYGMTRFSDLTYEEFTTKFLGLKPALKHPNNIPLVHAEIPKVQLPDKFDWREHGAVTEVKDQGSCGSCWAFSVTGNIEGQWKLQTGSLLALSEQELVDCDKLDQGCNGGLMDNAYRAIEELGGLELEQDYPYEGEDDKCAFNRTLSKVQISGAVNISSNETEMAKWLVANGPISIGINANAMQFYVGGISHPWKMLCSPTNLDHGVLIVGFGAKDYPLFHKHLPYWIVKNSWGQQWGEQGYYRVYRGDGTCGVNQMASSAVV